ncbi:helix-turn-helix transcriptional regulator [Acutalibacter caecimuris]|uniref:helix-turn-helix transcriptional regulator n=1 Tax=Acutalibacter caecimuris TaxID=3093657 RepID=UPI002AC93FA4|nr:helix-turn-helix transcriptional regulator [Acutalibacter sp. M00118]
MIEYRLRNGLVLLRDTDLTVTEICFEAGFSGPSYFSERFRKAFGCSPLEFRERPQKEK